MKETVLLYQLEEKTKHAIMTILQQLDVTIKDIQKEYSIEKAIHIDERLFDIYSLSERERKVIGFIEIN